MTHQDASAFMRSRPHFLHHPHAASRSAMHIRANSTRSEPTCTHILCSCRTGIEVVVWHSSPSTHTFSAHSKGSAMCTSWVSALLVTTPSCAHTTSLYWYNASQLARWERVHEFSSHTKVRTHPLTRLLCPPRFPACPLIAPSTSLYIPAPHFHSTVSHRNWPNQEFISQ